MKKTSRLFLLLIAFTLLISCALFVFGRRDGSVAADANGITKATSLHFINVNTKLAGENDCTANSVLIQHNGKNILIDTGIYYESSKEKVVEYLKKQGVQKVDYLILTHFHNDHIGGADAVVKSFDIGKVYFKMTDNLIKSNTYPKHDYDNVILSLRYKVNSDKTYPRTIEPKKEGYRVQIDKETYFEFYNCTEMFSDKNMGLDANYYSIMVLFAHGNAKAFIGGDAADLSDKYIVNKIGHVDVFGLQHHGTDLPYNSQVIFDELTPTYSIATTYFWDETVPGFNHVIYLPGKGVLKRAKKVNSTVLLTGDLDHIVFDSNSQNFIIRNKITISR